MDTIWKFPLDITDDQIVDMPAGAQVIHVGLQDEHLYLWAVVDPGRPLEVRRFFVRGTGHEVEAGLTHLGTVMMSVLPLVWHVFESGEER